jgi:hypothetical protein
MCIGEELWGRVLLEGGASADGGVPKAVFHELKER